MPYKKAHNLNKGRIYAWLTFSILRHESVDAERAAGGYHTTATTATTKTAATAAAGETAKKLQQQHHQQHNQSQQQKQLQQIHQHPHQHHHHHHYHQHHHQLPPTTVTRTPHHQQQQKQTIRSHQAVAPRHCSDAPTDTHEFRQSSTVASPSSSISCHSAGDSPLPTFPDLWEIVKSKLAEIVQSNQSPACHQLASYNAYRSQHAECFCFFQ